MHTSLLILGKREGQYVDAADVAGPYLCRLFYITDHNLGLQFLIDTGAQVSVVPPSPKDRPSPNSLTLQAVNGTTIRTYGSRSLTLNLSLRRTFRWIFVVADVTNAILGADFLQHFSLMVDMGKRRLIDSVTNLTVQGIQTTDLFPLNCLRQVHATSNTPPRLHRPILNRYPSRCRAPQSSRRRPFPQCRVFPQCNTTANYRSPGVGKGSTSS